MVHGIRLSAFGFRQLAERMAHRAWGTVFGFRHSAFGAWQRLKGTRPSEFRYYDDPGVRAQF